MTVVRAYLSSVFSNPGGWANPDNVLGAPDDLYATVDPARNVTAEITAKFDPAVIGLIPSDATLNSVPVLTTRVGVNSTGQSPSIVGQLYDGLTPIGAEAQLTITAGVADESRDAPAVTMTEILNNDLGLRFGALRTGNQSRIFDLDAAWLDIDYSAFEGSTINAWTGAWTPGKLKRYNGSSWDPERLYRWNGSTWEAVP